MNARVARIAAGQRGRVTTQQLADAGVDGDRVKRWVADGRLRREHRGVYALGHPDPSPGGVYMAAALAAGSGAVVSHRAAAFLLRIWPWERPTPEVTVATTAHRSRPGIVIHRVAALHVLDVATLDDGIPVTIVPRLLLDLAPSTPTSRLTRICHEAWVRHGTTRDQIDACIARNPHKPGAARLRDALGADVTLSELEDAFLVLIDDHGLPRPRTNIDRAGDKVDCHWPDHALTIELSYGDVTQRAAATGAELRRRLQPRAYDSEVAAPS